MRRDVSALWLSLLSPEQIDQFETGETFTIPHPDFPDVVDLFYLCNDCTKIHWQPTRFLLQIKGGHMCFVHERQVLVEVERLQHLYTPEDFELALEEATGQPTSVRRREACTHMPPAMFTERVRKHLWGGEVSYLEQVKRTGLDPSRFLGEGHSESHLKLIADAEIRRRLWPEPTHSEPLDA